MISWRTQQSGLFPGILGGRYKLIRFWPGRKGARVRTELHQIMPGGLEMFRGYLPVAAWHRSFPCRTCGAARHQGCRGTGRIWEGPMASVHRARLIAATVQATDRW